MKSLMKPLLQRARAACLPFLAALAMAAPPAHAFEAGKHYQVINPPQPVESKARVEVTVFFWYGCPHCFQLEPDVANWARNLPKGVVLKRQPAILGDSWTLLSQAYFALASIGAADRLHATLFNAVHLQGRRFTTPESVSQWVAQQGVDRAKFDAAWRSFGVAAQTQQARQMTQAYRLDGVPALAINGKYLTSPAMAGGYAEVIQVANELIERELKTRR